MMSSSRLDPLPRAPPRVAALDWPDLIAEFDRWAAAGRVAPLWWRDDDAADATPALADLFRVARGAPLALAVIPALATSSLVETLRQVPGAVVLQHGWRHVNRTPQTGDDRGRKSEYPVGLAAAVAATEVRAGRARLARLFGARALPVFVPPWNRIAADLRAVLAPAGMTALSTIASAKTPAPVAGSPPGLALVDVHVDLTDWKGGGRFIGAAAALAALVFWLRRARLGGAGAPIGILTHHMIMDRETAAFLATFQEVVAGHRGARWVDMAERMR